jgi:molecular chaperone IbpA
MNNLTNFFNQDYNFFDDCFTEINQKKFNNNFEYSINELSNTEFSIEVALPGFDKNNIEIEKIKNQIIIKKKSGKDNSDKFQLLKAFNLADNIQVNNASIKNGLLTIKLTKVIPEEDKPKLILIK